MNVRTVLLGAFAAIVIVGGGIAIGWWGGHGFATEIAMDIDRAQIQDRVDQRFPQKSCALMVACLTVSKPEVSLSEGSPRIGLAADVLVQLGHRQMRGRVAFSGVLRYVRYQGDFYLDDVRVDDLQMAGFPPELAEVVRLRGPAAIRRALEGQPVYSIKSDSARSAFLKLAVSDVRVVDGRVRVSFLRIGG